MSETNGEQDTDLLLASLTVQMRIYDVLMALLTLKDKDVARELLELHSTGALMGPAPSYIGEFLTDKVNDL